MRRYLFLPLSFLKFWFYEAPRAIVGFFASLNNAFFQLFGLVIFIKTFFKPLKNEYRQGLVGFSRWMGMAVKALLITADLVILTPLLLFEAAVLVLFLTSPIMTFWLLFL
jgi:hypothetical protein